MNAHEFALLFAIAVPFLAIVALNLFLFARGERGTLLLPSGRELPSEATPAEMDALLANYRVSSLPAATNDAGEREAA
jgi:hypothetical protein